MRPPMPREVKAGSFTAQDADLSDAVGEHVRRRLGRTSASSEIAQLSAILAVMVIAVEHVPHAALLSWAAMVAGVQLLRAWSRRCMANCTTPGRALFLLRATSLLQGLTWGLAPVLGASYLPMAPFTLTVVICGAMVAAASIVVRFDSPSFFLFSIAATTPAGLAILMHGRDSDHYEMFAVLAIFMIVVGTLQRRTIASAMRSVTTGARLAISERRFHQLADNIPEVFYVSSADLSRVLYVSPAYDEVWGRPGADLYDNPRGFLEPVHPDDLGAFVGLIERVQHGEGGEVEFRLTPPDGSTRWIHNRIMPVLDRQGLVVRIVGVARDVTEQIRSRQAEQHSREEAERATAAKSAFLANMSHEIRTPMSGVLGMVELLRDTTLTQEQQNALEVIDSSGEALLSILNDILDLSKIEAGEMEIEHAPFDLHQTIDATVRLLAPRAFARGLELVCDIDEDVPREVAGDSVRLRQIITNLVGDAIKFTAKGEVVIDVELLARADGHATLQLRVSDTGVGIAADQLDHIFQPFGQADQSTTRRFGGTGLGLPITRRLARLMGGDVSVFSRPGKGSTFSAQVRLDVPIAMPSAPGAPRPAGIAGLRTLIVDDNAVNREMMRRALSQAGAVLTEAGGADAALDALREAARAGTPCQLLISDVRMPDRDGFDLARAIRDDAALRATPIMMLTSDGRRGDAERCRNLHIAGYLMKPVSRVDLIEAVLAVRSVKDQAAPALLTRHTIEAARRRLRILLAEDNRVNQQVTTAMLLKRGHVVDVVENGRLAVEAVEKQRYDVVLMDMHMPELDGMAATREIRRLLKDQSPPIIALTANVMRGERERCLANGMDGYVGKPFKGHELFAAVEGWSGTASTATVDIEPSESQPAIDVGAFRAGLKEAGVEDAAPAILAQFQTDAPGRLTALHAALTHGTSNEITSAAHAYKSAARTVHAKGLADALQRIELAGNVGDAGAARAETTEVTRLHDAVLAALAVPGLLAMPT